MERIENKSFGRQDVVILDDKSFLGCSFVGCTIVYNGGLTEWNNCHFDTCRLTLGEAANRTKQVLEGLGFSVVPPSGGFEISMSRTIH
jgi:hypothetical protein